MEPPRKKSRPSSVDYDAIETLVKRRDDASREFERLRAEASRVSRTAVDTFDHRACQLAAAEDNLECLRYVYECQHACAQRIVLAATENGHLQCLKHVYKHGCPWDKLTRTKDAEKAEKRLWELITYMYENECPWSCSTCESAAQHGHLECLTYAREVGADGTDYYADILDDYVQLWMPFIEHIAIAGRGTTPELSARQFHELYKEFDAHRLTLKARLRERASDILLERHKRARHLDMWTEYRAVD